MKRQVVYLVIVLALMVSVLPAGGQTKPPPTGAGFAGEPKATGTPPAGTQGAVQTPEAPQAQAGEAGGKSPPAPTKGSQQEKFSKYQDGSPTQKDLMASIQEFVWYHRDIITIIIVIIIFIVFIYIMTKPKEELKPLPKVSTPQAVPRDQQVSAINQQDIQAQRAKILEEGAVLQEQQIDDEKLQEASREHAETARDINAFQSISNKHEEIRKPGFFRNLFKSHKRHAYYQSPGATPQKTSRQVTETSSVEMLSAIFDKLHDQSSNLNRIFNSIELIRGATGQERKIGSIEQAVTGIKVILEELKGKVDRIKGEAPPRADTLCQDLLKGRKSLSEVALSDTPTLQALVKYAEYFEKNYRSISQWLGKLLPESFPPHVDQVEDYLAEIDKRISKLDSGIEEKQEALKKAQKEVERYSGYTEFFGAALTGFLEERDITWEQEPEPWERLQRIAQEFSQAPTLFKEYHRLLGFLVNSVDQAITHFGEHAPKEIGLEKLKDELEQRRCKCNPVSLPRTLANITGKETKDFMYRLKVAEPKPGDLLADLIAKEHWKDFTKLFRANALACSLFRDQAGNGSRFFPVASLLESGTLALADFLRGLEIVPHELVFFETILNDQSHVRTSYGPDVPYPDPQKRMDIVRRWEKLGKPHNVIFDVEIWGFNRKGEIKKSTVYILNEVLAREIKAKSGGIT